MNSNSNESAYNKFKQERLSELAKLPIHHTYEPVEGLYIPLGMYMAVKEVEQDAYQTKTGVWIPNAKQLEECRLGVVYSIGESCATPIKVGDMIAFDKGCCYGVTYKGVQYLRVGIHEAFFIVPPDNYVDAHYADFHEKRRKSRLKGAKVAEKRDNEKLEQKFEDRDSQNKKTDYIEGKDTNKTIIK